MFVMMIVKSDLARLDWFTIYIYFTDNYICFDKQFFFLFNYIYSLHLILIEMTARVVVTWKMFLLVLVHSPMVVV